MLREEVASAGRVWLLLQHIDKDSSGWVTAAEARRRLTEERSALRIFGERQLRKLLAKGDGLYWQQSDDRIWLRSTAKVAASLGISHLAGRRVAVPVDDLLKGMGHVRAHLYASFHSGRNKPNNRDKSANLIARSTLQRLSHVSRRSQQRYEKRAGIESQSNIAIGGASNVESDQRTAWKKGTAAFRFADSSGKIGRKGAAYAAWQLPNKYIGPHETLPKGKQKRINRELADLFMKGMTGNDKLSTWNCQRYGLNDTLEGGTLAAPWRLYHSHSSSAASIYARHPNRDAYWPDIHRSIGSSSVWFSLGGDGD